MFTGLSRDYPGTVPGLCRPFPEISWEFCLCVSLFRQEKGKHINNLTPTHFRDNPAKLFMFIGFFSPRHFLVKKSAKMGVLGEVQTQEHQRAQTKSAKRAQERFSVNNRVSMESQTRSSKRTLLELQN